MAESFLFGFNAVFPIILLVALGMFFRKTGFLGDDFCSIADKFVFNVALPLNNGLSVYNKDLGAMFGKETFKVILFCVSGITAVFAALCVITPLFIKDRAKCGSFIQGVYRSNYAIFAVPLVTNMFGDAGNALSSIMLPWVVILFNVYAVLTFTFFYGGDSETTGKEAAARIVRSTVKNPLIIGNLTGVLFMVLRSFVPSADIPAAVLSPLKSVSSLATPLALISIGVNFSFKALKGRAGLAVTGAAFKTALVPLCAVAAAAAFGFRGVELSVILVTFGSPTAVSSYIMAKQMKGDAPLASQILLFATVFSLFTMFSFAFVLKYIDLL